MFREVLVKVKLQRSFLLSVASYVGLIVGFLSQLYIARLLGVRNYGILSLILVYPSLLYSLSSSKSVSVLTPYASRYRNEDNKDGLLKVCVFGYGIDVCTSVIVSFIILSTSSFVSIHIFKQPEISRYINFYSLSLPFLAIANTNYAIINTYERYQFLSFLNLLEKISLAFFVIILVPLEKIDIMHLTLGYAFSNFIYGSVGLIVSFSLLKRTEIDFSKLLHPKKFFYEKNERGDEYLIHKKLFSAYFWNFSLVSISGITTQVPIMLLGSLGKPELAGFYRIALLFSTAATYPKTALVTTITPQLAVESKNMNWNQALRKIKLWTFKIGIPLGFVIAGISFLIFPIVVFFYGHRYSLATPGIQIMLIGSAVLSIVFWIEPLYFCRERYNLFTKIHFAYFLFFISSSLIFVKYFEFIGMCFADMLSKVFLVSLLLFNVKSIYLDSHPL